jgi:hypothetical protein
VPGRRRGDRRRGPRRAPDGLCRQHLAAGLDQNRQHRARAFSTSTGSNRDTGIVAGFFAAATGLATSPSRFGCTEPEIASAASRQGRPGGLQSPEKRGNHMRSAVPASEVTTESTMTEVTRRAAQMVNTARDQVAVIETPVAMMQMMMKTEVVASIEVSVIE